MITANELRIGNWFKNGNSYHQSTGVLNKGSYYKSISGHGDVFAYYEALEPISLTEEILLKCGFEKTDEDCYHLQSYWYSKELNYKIIIDDEDQTFWTGNVRRGYLHEFQNKIQMDTGKEFEINL